MTKKRRLVAAASAVATAFSVALISGPISAYGDTVSSALGSAYGVKLDGPVTLDPTPTVTANIPPGSSDHEEDALVHIPADPLATSFTAKVEADAARESTVAATLQSGRFNSRGYAITEDLEALQDTLTADVIESESLTRCVGDQERFGSAMRLVNLSLNGQPIDIPADPQPNTVLLDALGIRIVMWETNWNPATNGTTDGSDTVFTNALHVTAPGDIDLVVSHSEATASCGGDDGGAGAERAGLGDVGGADLPSAPPADAVTSEPSFTG